MAQILKRAGRRIGDSHCYRHAAVLFMYGAIEIEFPFMFNGLGCPCTVICPVDIVQGEDLSVIGPVYHVLCREAAPVIHGIKIIHQCILVVSGVKIQGISVHHRRRIGGIVVFDDRVCVE